MASGLPTLFSDSGYTQAASRFNSGQIVYLRIPWKESGDKEKTLRLLNSNKSEINRFSLNQSGGYYTSSFSAPKSSGVYYVDVRIDNGSGSILVNQQDINVGQENSGSVVAASTSVTTKGGLVKGQSTVNQPTATPSTKVIKPKVTPTVSPVPTPIVAPEESKPISFFERIRLAIKKIFSALKLK